MFVQTLSLWLALVGAGDVPVPAEERAFVEMLNGIASSDPAVVQSSLDIATNLASPALEAPLRTVALTHSHSTVRAAAAFGIGELGWPRDSEALQGRIELLAKLGGDRDLEVRIAAAGALGKYPTPEARKLLTKLEVPPEVLDSARRSMGEPTYLRRLSRWMSGAYEARLPGEWVTAQAALVVTAEPASANRATVQRLGHVDASFEVRSLLYRLIRHGEPGVARASLDVLFSRPLKQDTAILRWALSHENPDVRSSAAKNLGQHVSSDVAALLSGRIVEDSNLTVVKHLGIALRRQAAVDVCAGMKPVLLGPEGYRRDLAAFLVRDKDEEEDRETMLWCHLLAEAVSPDQAELEFLRSTPPELLRDSLGPFLSPKKFSSLETEMQRTVLSVLSGTDQASLQHAIVSLLTPSAENPLIDALAPAITELPDDVAVPYLRSLLQQPALRDPSRIYALILQRPGFDGTQDLVRGLREQDDMAVVLALLVHVVQGGGPSPEVVAAIMARMETWANHDVLSEGLRALAAVKDPNLAPVLIRLVHDHPNKDLGKDAYAKLIGLPAPAPLLAARELASDRQLSKKVRLKAVEDVGRLGDSQDIPLLESLREDPNRDVRTAARNALHQLRPEDYPHWDAWGRYPFVAASAGFGATLFALTSEGAGASGQKALVTVGGAAVGGSTAFLLTLDRDVSLGEAGYFTTSGVWGTLAGAGISRLSGLSTKHDGAPQWGAVIGETVGLGIGATMGRSRFTPRDVLRTNLVASSWGLGSLGMARLLRLDERDTDSDAGAFDLFSAGTFVAMLPMLYASPRIEFEGNERIGTTLSAGAGMWFGGFLPFALRSDAEPMDAVAGIALGQALGMTAGIAWSNHRDGFDPRTLGWASAGMGSGALLGAGLALTQPSLRDDQRLFGMLTAGSAVSGITLGAFGSRLEFKEQDALMLAYATAAGGAGSMLGHVLHTGVSSEPSLKARGGAAMFGTAVGFYGGLLATQLVDPSVGDVGLSLGGATILGMGLGGLAWMSPGVERERFPVLFDVGFAAGGLGMALLAPQLRYEPPDAALTLTTMGLGAGLGVMLPAFWRADGTDAPDTERVGGAMVGGMVGSLGATAITQLAHRRNRSMTYGRVLRADLGALGGMALGGGLGLMVPRLERRATAGLVYGGAVAGYAAALIKEPSGMSSADRVHLGMGAAQGAWMTGLVPLMWRSSDDEIPTREVVGGALFGLAAGQLLSRGLVHRRSLDGADVVEVGAVHALGSALGGGAALLGASLSGDRRKLGASLLTGGGLLGWGVGEWMAPHTEYSPRDGLLISSLMAQGALLGTSASFWGTLEPSSQTLGGGVLLGAGLGGALGLGLSQGTEFEPADVAETWAFASLGALMGSGIAATTSNIDLSEPGEGGVTARGANVGALGGLALGLSLAHVTEFSTQDYALMGSAAAVGMFVGGHLPRAVRGEKSRSEIWGAGAGAGAGGAVIATALASQFFELELRHTGAATFLSTAGALTAGGFAHLGLPQSPRAEGWTRAGAALGAYGLGLALAPVTEFSDGDWGLLGVGTALGAWHGAFFPVALGKTGRDGTTGGLMAGTGLGAAVGYGAAQLLDLSASDNLELLAASSVGSLIGAGATLAAGHDIKGVARGLEIGSLSALTLGAVTLRHTDYRHSHQLITSAALWGTWSGAWLARGLAWKRAGQGDSSELGVASGGGAMAGLGLGLALGMGASQGAEFSWDETAEATFWMGAGNLIGGGAAMIASDSRAWRAGLMQGVGLAGLLGGLAMADRTQYGGTDVGLTTYTLGVGALHGALLAGYEPGQRALNTRRAGGGALLGAGVGLASGMVLSQFLSLEKLDLVEMGVMTALGDAVGVGLAQLTELDGAGYFGLVGGAGLGVTALGIGLAQATDFDRADRLLTLHGASYGAWVGAWTPLLWNSENGELAGSEDAAAGALLGLGVGALTSGLLSQYLELDAGDVGEVTLGSAMGTTFGAGLAMVASEDNRWMVGAMHAAGLAGTLALGALAPHAEVEAKQVGLGSLSGLYGVYQGAGLSLLAGASNRQVAGAMMAGGAAGALLGTYLGPRLNLNATDMWMLTAGSAWGSWLGIWTAAYVDERSDPEQGALKLGVGTTALLTDVALLTTSLAISRFVELEPLRFAWISVSGGMGLLVGSSVAGMTNKSVRGGLLFGTAGGLLAGTLLTQFVDLPGMGPARRRAAQGAGVASLQDLDPLLVPPRKKHPLRPQIETWMPSVQVGPIGDPQQGDVREGQQFLFTVSGTYR